jgi:DNA-binding MarR family transcriptional regulator
MRVIMSRASLDQPVAAVRHFNRFYTKRIGVLREKLLRSPFSLAQVRVLYELAHRQKLTAVELCQELGLDPGYLSRILRDFQKQGLVDKQPSAADARRSLLRLTKRGRRTFADLNKRQEQEIVDLLSGVSKSERGQLMESMSTIERLLGRRREHISERVPYILRPHRPGDMGWVVHRHGVLYAQEQGYDERFEALVAGIVAEFIEKFDPARERCWIAERDGENLGCIFLVKKSKTVAKLRMLLVEPSARGVGLGKRLVDECVAFAREATRK